MQRDLVNAREASLIAKVRAGTFGAERTAGADPASAPPRRLGNYRLDERLGSGGIGEVWRGTHEVLGTPAAIKLLRPEHGATDELKRRFLREARAAAAVRHRHIVEIHDFGVTEAGTPYMVMEYLGRRSLADLVARGPVPWAAALPLLRQMTSAIAHAHAAGVIHLDLKPSNVMLTEGEPLGCKIIDFGLAKCLTEALDTSTLTQSGQVLGSPAYMSPEQFRGHRMDARSDVYSLGCVAYFLLSGTRPYPGRTASECMYQHLLGPVATLPEVKGGGTRNPAIAAAVAKAMAKDPAHRFPGMQEFAAALEDADRGVAPGTGPTPGRSHDRRSRRISIGIAVVALGGIAAGVASREIDPSAGITASRVVAPPETIATPDPPARLTAPWDPAPVAPATGTPDEGPPAMPPDDRPTRRPNIRPPRQATASKNTAPRAEPAPKPGATVATAPSSDPPKQTPAPARRPFTPPELPDPLDGLEP